MIKIGLRKIKLFAHHGVLAEELERGNFFYTDVMVWYAHDKSVQTDELEDTFDYQIIYDAVKEEMATPSNLLEHLAGRIIENLALKEPLIKKIKVKIEKTNPPISGDAQYSVVELKKDVNC